MPNDSSVVFVMNPRGPTCGSRVDIEPHEFQPADYGKSSGGWYCRPPWKHAGGNLNGHTVTEHEDGTISVQPSILINIPGVGMWHGWLVKGWWTACEWREEG